MRKKILQLLAVLALTLGVTTTQALNRTVTFNGAGNVDFTASGSAGAFSNNLQTAINQLANGETLTFLEAGTYATTGTLNFNDATVLTARSITVTSTASGLVTLSGGDTGSINIGRAGATCAAQTVTITGGANRIKFLTASTLANTVVLCQDTNTGITHSLIMSNVDVQNTGLGGTNTDCRAGFNLRGSSGTAYGGPVVATATDCTFTIGNSINSGRCAAGMSDGTNLVINDVTMTLTNCALSYGSVAGNLNGSAFQFSGGNNLANPQARDINVTLNGCTLHSWGTVRPTIGNNGGGNVRMGINVNLTCNDCTFTNHAGAYTVNWPNTGNDIANKGDNHWTFNRCTMDNSVAAVLTHCVAFRMDNITTNPADFLSNTLKLYNCLVKSASGAGNTNARAVRTQGYVETTLYHNTFISQNTTGVSTEGDAGIGIISQLDVTSPTLRVSDNIIYNYTRPISFTNTAGSLGTAVPVIVASKNLIAGPNDDAVNLGANRIYAGTGVLVGTNVIGFDYIPLSSSPAVNAADSQVAGVPDGVISVAIGGVDHSNTSRGSTGTWDIGAFEIPVLPSVPLPSGIFTSARNWTLY